MSQQCYHCHEAIIGSGYSLSEADRATLPEAVAAPQFCCAGCRAVYLSIRALNVERYYRYRSEAAVKPATEQPDNFGWMDRLLEQLEFIERLPTEKTQTHYRAQLLVEGVRCSACAWLIERALIQQPGVVSASVQLAGRRLELVWQQHRQPLSALLQLLGRLGYTASGWSHQQQWQQYQAEKNRLIKYLGVAGICMMQVGMLSIGLYAGEINGRMASGTVLLLRSACALLCLLALAYSGRPFYQSAVNALRNRSVNMDLPITLALAIAYGYSLVATAINAADVYYDTVAMLLFFLWLSRFVEYRSRGLFLPPQRAVLPVQVSTRTAADNFRQAQTQLRSQLQPGDHLLCKRGDTLAADGVLLNAAAAINRAAFTGESDTVHARRNELINAGAVNLGEPFWVCVQSAYGCSSFDSIQNLATTAGQNKPFYQRLIDRISPYFTVAVLTLAALAAAYWLLVDSSKALTAAIAIMVVSCPCALSLATPLAMAVANRTASNRGIISRDANIWSQLPPVKQIVFDKTGTLTDAIAVGDTIATTGLTPGAALQIAASLEAVSSHPLAAAFLARNTQPLLAVDKVQSVDGCGIAGVVNGNCYRLGKPGWSLALLQYGGAETPFQHCDVVLASASGEVAGFTLTEALKPDAQATVNLLQSRGYQLHIFSGDNLSKVAAVAKKLGIESYRAALSPQQKLTALQQLQADGNPVLCVGDGVNDAPLLAAANASFAVANASTLAVAKAGILLNRAALLDIVYTLQLARRTRSILVSNFAWAILYNTLAVALAATGTLPPWLAAIGMTLSSLLVMWRSRTIGRPDRKPQRQQAPRLGQSVAAT